LRRQDAAHDAAVGREQILVDDREQDQQEGERAHFVDESCSARCLSLPCDRGPI
jgi:hypothetical protein